MSSVRAREVRDGVHVRDGDLDGDPDEGHASLFDSSAVRVVALGTFARAKVVPCAPYVSVHVPPGSNKSLQIFS